MNLPNEKTGCGSEKSYQEDVDKQAPAGPQAAVVEQNDIALPRGQRGGKLTSEIGRLRRARAGVVHNDSLQAIMTALSVKTKPQPIERPLIDTA
jgi:hypothetical protein